MKRIFLFLLPLLLVTTLCFGDLLLLAESSLSTNLDKEGELSPELGLSLGWDTYSFLSQNFSFFLDSLGMLNVDPVTGDLNGEADLSTDFSYRTENFLARVGADSTYIGKTNEKVYLDIVPELYLSYGTTGFTFFTRHNLSYLPFTSGLELYEARVGVAFSLDTLLNKPKIGVGVDLENSDHPIYAIAEYELSWYPDPLFSLDVTAGVYWYLMGEDYQRYLAEMDALWYTGNGLIFNVGLTTQVINSGFYSEPEVKLQPKFELGITVSENSILSVVVDGTLFVTKSYLGDPSLVKLSLKYSFIF
jgi:hypothetical protein